MHRETVGTPTAPAATASAALTLAARGWPALPAIGVVVLVLVGLGFDGGGYFPAAFTSAGAIACVALAVLVLKPARTRFSVAALIAMGTLAGFAFWTGLSRAWSNTPDVPLLDMQRAMLYLALFGLALLAADNVRNTRLLMWSVLGVIVAIAGAGVLSRLQPDIVASPSEPFFAVLYRLDYPLGYFNAFGALAAMGAVLAAGLAADARASVVLRATAAGAVPLLAAAMYLSLSRGAWLALIVGIVVLIAAAPGRGPLLVTGALAAVAILRVRGYPALVTDPKAGTGQATQGDAYTWQLVGLVLVAAGAQAALARAGMAAALDQRIQAIRRIALIGGAALVVLAAIAGYAAKGDEAEGGVTAAVNDTTNWLDRQWRDFLDPTTAPELGTARLTSAKGSRSEAYRIALDGFAAQPLIGEGAGSYELRHARERRIDEKVRDAHSLPLQTLSELGIVGLLLLLVSFGAVAAGARRALNGKGAMRPAEAAAVIAACAVWLAHACVDWDWEMPALTGTALVLSATLFQRGRRRRSPRRRSASAA